ncbi:diguanylate cyclase [Rhodovulum sulfidophilum]|nr:diguanylate cyclase [Rhodovulum sulfidophilum]
MELQAFTRQLAACGPDTSAPRSDRLDLFQIELDLQNRELLEAHAASERERRKYLTLFERLPLPAVVLDRGGVVREANEAAAAVFGFATTEQLCNRSVYRMLDETARSRLHAYLAAPPSGTEEGPATAIPVHVGRPRDGVYLSYDAHLARLPACSEEDGRVHMLLVDRHSDDRQEHERHCHQMLSESTSTLIHAFDLTGNLIFANRAASAYLDGAETLSVEQRRAFDGLLGSRALDIEVLIAGKPTSNQARHATAPDDRRSFLIQKFPLRDDSGKIVAVGGTSTDVSTLMAGHSDLHAAFSLANDLANRDPLTGLANRPGFLERLRDALSRLDPMGKGLALGFLDIDAFKDINDGMGHEVGDAILSAFARRLEDIMGERACLGRFGGDEFLFFIADSTPEEAERLLQRTLGDIRSPYEVAGTRVLLTCSAGLSHYPRDAERAEDLLRAADMALYSAKSNGRDRISHFKESLRFTSERRLRVFSALRKALCEDSFRLVFQPKFDISDRRKIIGAEALLRWRDPQLGGHLSGRIRASGRGQRPLQRARPAGAQAVRPAAGRLGAARAAGAGLGEHLGTLAARHRAGALGSGAARLSRDPARIAFARDHRDRADELHRRGDPEPGQPGRCRGADLDRRFRHRLFVARLSAEAAPERAEDRPQLHRPSRCRGRRRRWGFGAYRAGDAGPGREPAALDRGRGDRDRGTTGLAGRKRLRIRSGLSGQPGA